MSKRTRNRELTNARKACVVEAARTVLTEEFGTPLRMLFYTVRQSKKQPTCVPSKTWLYDIFGLACTKTRGPLRVFEVTVKINCAFFDPDEESEHLLPVKAEGNTSLFRKKEVWEPKDLRFSYSFDYSGDGFFTPRVVRSELRGIRY